MKKLICLVLIAVMALSLASCAETSTTGGNSGGESTPAGGESTPAGGESGGETDVSSSFPLTYTPKWSSENIKTEDNPDGTLAYGYGGVAYDPNAEIALEYCKDEDKLFTALNGASDWPAELDEAWKGYGYVAIETNETASKRTLAVGQYGSKHATVIRQHEQALNDTGIRPDSVILATPGDGSRYVDYCMLVANGDVTIKQIATAAHEALYLQAWNFVPADKQGVQITANGKTYTVNDILEEMAG